MFDLVKGWYLSEMWNLALVRKAVVASWITQDDYHAITGEDFVTKVAVDDSPVSAQSEAESSSETAAPIDSEATAG